MLTTKTPRLVLLLIAFLIWTPAAYAWSWPVQGPVLRPFSYDSAHPYASGQHRGIDIEAGSAGETVVAPAAGTVSFAGTVAANGESVTIQTSDGYSVTLTHLGSILVARGAAVGEGEAIGTAGPSGSAEVGGPYVHLGIRITADQNGYLDPLTLLPPSTTGGDSSGSTSSQPGSSGSSSATPAEKSATAPPSGPNKRGSTPAQAQGRVSHDEKRAQKPRAEVGTRPSAQRPVAHSAKPDVDASHPTRSRQRHVAKPESPSRRPVVEPAAPAEPTGLDAGHEIRWSASAAPRATPRRRPTTGLLPPVLNGAAALVAVAAAFAAARGRRRRFSTRPIAAGALVHLPRRHVERRPATRAA